MHNAPASKTPTAAHIKPTTVPHSISSVIAAAGLPADKISASIVAFARFFSLPLKPELMNAIHRQVISPSAAATQSESTKPAVTDNVLGFGKLSHRETTALDREALSLAAVAAESKGLGLRPEGLEGYAEAVDPDWQNRHKERDNRGRRNKNHDEQDNPLKNGSISASSLKEWALESAEKDPLLAILNRLPGKNGQRWVVLPFSFCIGGRKFSVTLKILLESKNQAVMGSRMALDIAEKGEYERSWLFVMKNRESAAGNAFDKAQAFSKAELAVYLQPELPPLAHASFAGELSRFMEIPPERISIRNRAEVFSDDMLRSINEVV